MNEDKIVIDDGVDSSTEVKFDDMRNLRLWYYDCSDETRHALSAEIAYHMAIPFDSLAELFQAIGATRIHADLSDIQLLTLLKSHYPGFFSLKQILESAKITHQCERDPWP